jgi:hypothetical protein
LSACALSYFALRVTDVIVMGSEGNVRVF